jgi:hypothetical protein
MPALSRPRPVLALLALLPFAMTDAARAQAPGERSALPPRDCDRACLVGIVNDYLAALGRRDPSRLPLAPDVRYAENDVELPHGKAGIWATATGVAPTGLTAADPSRGEVAWIGAVDEHGAPVYYGLRLQVRDRRITEAEAVVVRNSGLPLPWGDFAKLEHDPAFNEVLPEASRRPRERLRAVADSYFNTVELNDGVVFAPFHEDCARIENGISTTRASATAGPGGSGNASSISPGCEAQFRLGIYYINKRIRERRYPVIDEERGVVVATGFFDHANGFDRYKLTDGREMRTALKWPNSISLVEAFKIVDGKIFRIETVFSYVPYFMPNPFYVHPAPPPPPRVRPTTREAPCADVACLQATGDAVVEALVARRHQDIRWADIVRYSENGVSMAIGDGLWASVRSKGAEAVRVADPVTGNYAWYGLLYDHDAPAYAGLRVKLAGRRVAEIEAVVARERNPGPWLPPAQYRVDAATGAALPPGERAARRQLLAAVERAGEGAPRVENGQALAPRRLPQPLRAARVIAVDEARGIVVRQGLADYRERETPYVPADGGKAPVAVNQPVTRELFEVWRVRGGSAVRVDAVSVFQPYGMPTPWSR